MLRRLSARSDHLPLAVPFTIARGTRTTADLVIVEIEQDGVIGRGEGTPIPRYGVSVDGALAQIADVSAAVEGGMARTQLMEAMPAGAARNAVDCALWDLEAQLAGRSVAETVGVAATYTVAAQTISIDTPQAMGEAAAALGSYPLVKVKVGRDDPAARLRAVRAAVPTSTLIVDANEGWDVDLLVAMLPVVEELKIALLEQPLPAGDDAALRTIRSPVPLCADESCHLAADVAGLADRYQAVNIKLDKTGGLTAALDLLAAARARGMTVMTGCMICSSLSIAPTFLIAAQSDYADLDGPLWLSRDRDGGVTMTDGRMTAPSATLWGGVR